MNDGLSDSDTFRRLEEAFHEAQVLPESERSVWLANCFGGDGTMRNRLERMLASAASDPPTRGIAEDLAQIADAEASHARATPGRLAGMRLGAYRLTEFKGEGGFGEVYLAEQLEPIRRRVAIKVLRDDRTWGESLDRFKGEVESLARLEHPGIARIYDAGEATPIPDGGDSAGAPDASVHPVPFIAMEFVDGVTITTDATRRAAGLRERLRVVASAADAIHYAHQRGIIHRDIKPSNMLVTEVNGVASPKIIDFGIAKVVDAASLEGPSVDRPGEARSRAVTGVLGTPRYMSPEQSDRRRSQDVDTRTDIYSIGVILGELLRGSRPAAEPDALQLSEQRRTGWSIDVPRSMRDDLDRIINKATHPDRERRYTSAAAFADDLRRVQAGEPVSAGPATLRYRASRFLWRNRLVAAALLVACAALLGGSIAALAGLLKAREQAARADAVNGFLEDVLTSVSPERRGADVPLSTVMGEASASVAARFAGQPLVEAETRSLIGATYASLWRMELAAHEYQLAMDLYADALGSEDPKTVRMRVRQSQVIASLGRLKEVDASSGELLDLVRRVLGPRSREAATVELMRARLAVVRGRIDEGAQALSEADAWIRREFADDPELIGMLLADRIRILRRIAFNKGFVTEEARARLHEAYDLSIELVEHQRSRTPSKVLETLVAENEHSRAALDIRRYQESLEVSSRVLSESEGTLSDCHDARLEALELQSYALRAMGEGERALASYRHVMTCRRDVESGAASTIVLVSREFDLIPFLDYAGHFEESQEQCRRVIEMLGAFGDMGSSIRFAAQTYLARSLSQLGRKDEATTLFVELAADVKARPADAAGRLYAFMAGHFATVGRSEEARMAIDASFNAMPPQTTGSWQYHVDDRLVVLVEACEALGDVKEAEAYKAERAGLLEANRKKCDAPSRLKTPDE